MSYCECGDCREGGSAVFIRAFRKCRFAVGEQFGELIPCEATASEAVRGYWYCAEHAEQQRGEDATHAGQ